MAVEHITNTAEMKDTAVFGVVGVFDRPEDLVRAGRELHHTLGYTKLDAFSPFPIHGIDDAIGVPRSKLGFIVFACGLFGLLNAVFMIWYTNGVDYPLVIGGKPLFAFEFSVPVMFELTVLLSAFGAVFGMLALNKLPTFYHPTFNFAEFARVTDDKFMLVIEASDPKFNTDEVRKALTAAGATKAEVVEA